MYGNIGTPKLQSTFQYHSSSINRLYLQRTISDILNICCMHLSMYSVYPHAECPDGFYGEDCGEKCECENKGQCDHQTGRCTCTPGWRGRTCTKREEYTFLLFFKSIAQFYRYTEFPLGQIIVSSCSSYLQNLILITS